MSMQGFTADHTAGSLPQVRKIRASDVWDALAMGIDDFKAMPSHLAFLGLIYPIVGLVLARVSDQSRLMPLVFPLAAGFALIGPFAAVAPYELSRRREQSLSASSKDILGLRCNPAIYSILALGALLYAIFVLWLLAA
jgi:uncharacterized membrane protein